MSDEIMRRMAQKGFTKIAYPRSEFGVFTLVYEWKRRRGSANDFDYLAPGLMPRLLPAAPITDIPDLEGTWSRERDISIGLSILSGLLTAIGGGSLGLKGGFKDSKTIKYSYSGLAGEYISPSGLGQHLGQFSAPSSPPLSDWLGDNLYVATGVLTARAITVEAKKESGQTADIDVKAIEDQLGVESDVKIDTKNEYTITFEGKVPVPVGLRLFKIRKTESGNLALQTINQGKVEIKVHENGAQDDLPDLDPGVIDATNPDEPMPVRFYWDPEADI